MIIIRNRNRNRKRNVKWKSSKYKIGIGMRKRITKGNRNFKKLLIKLDESVVF